jgi:hypothetical protein
VFVTFGIGELDGEVAKHFRGTPATRVQLAQDMGRRAVEMFRSARSTRLTYRDAVRVLQRNTHRGRRPSRVMAARDA